MKVEGAMLSSNFEKYHLVNAQEKIILTDFCYRFQEKMNKNCINRSLYISDQSNVWDSNRLITKLKWRYNDMLIFWEIFKYYSTLAKTCKKYSLCSNRLLASTVIFNKLWAKLYLQYPCALLVQLIRETNDKTVT